MTRNHSSGFTLIEVMTAVLIASVLSVTSVATYGKYKMKTSVAEGYAGINQLYHLTVLYSQKKVNEDLRLTAAQALLAAPYKFPYLQTRPLGASTWFSPNKGKKAKLECYKPTVTSSTWSQYVDCDTLGFGVADPTYFVYQVREDPNFAARSEKPKSMYYTFRIEARADLDGDGNWMDMSRSGGIGANSEFYGDAQVFASNPD